MQIKKEELELEQDQLLEQQSYQSDPKTNDSPHHDLLTKKINKIVEANIILLRFFNNYQGTIDLAVK